MRYRLKYGTTAVPYNAPYEINRPDLGMVGFGSNFEMLETNVRKYRLANGIPTGLGFSEELESCVCQYYPNECTVTDTVLPLQRRLTFGDVVDGTKVIASFKAAGSPYVPKEEAERRAAICSRCPLCVTFPKPCNGICGELKTLVDSLLAGYQMPQYDSDPRACSICHCFFSAHVRIPYEYLNKGLDDEQRAQFQEAAKLSGCWKTVGAI